MDFFVIEHAQGVPQEGRNICYLRAENWNDYYDYETLYVLTYFDVNGVPHEVGGVKIGQFNWPAEQKRPALLPSFSVLDGSFFSLGQDAEYYEKLKGVGFGIDEVILAALNDVAADENLFVRAKEERVMGVSLMRSVQERTVTQQYRRIIAGGLRRTRFNFEYHGPAQIDPDFEPVELKFQIMPGSKPPTNIQVIIGSNGVGKSFLINAMSRALTKLDEGDDVGEFVEPDTVDAVGEFVVPNAVFDEDFESPFANVLSITFSAFDDFPIIRQVRNVLEGVQYANVGLRKLKKIKDNAGQTKWRLVTQEPNDLAKGFIESAKMCAVGERLFRWRRALRTLETDPIFADEEFSNLTELEGEKFSREAGRRFRKLSSGHKIVLLTITELVEKVEERTLVLMDEPEAHLHPPLLSALIRAVSDLLINRNGVAIIATHSPVVLQEVPKSCVWKMRRHGGCAVVERPERETFAEHVGVLTHEVFGLEVTQSGFQKMLEESIGPNDNFDDVVERFDGAIGYEGRALISSLIALRDTEGDA